MRRIRIGQIGTGHFHAEATMETVRKFPDVFEVVGIAELYRENLEKNADKKNYRGLKWMSPEELLRVEGLDAVLVETNEWDLLKVGQQCIDAGVHIHLDKPAGEDIDAYAKMLSDAKRKNLTVQLGYMYRYNPAMRYCKRAIETGMLGDIFELDTVMSTEHTKEVREYLARFKGGTMYIFGCHLIDLVIWMLGKPMDIIAYQGSSGVDGVNFADNGLAVFVYPRGASTVRTTSVEVKGYERRQLVLCGSKGTLEVRPLEAPTVMTQAMIDHSKGHMVYMYDNNVRRTKVDLPKMAGRYDDQLLDFAAMIRGKKNPFTYEHELLVAQATMKACGLDVSLGEKYKL